MDSEDFFDPTHSLVEMSSADIALRILTREDEREREEAFLCCICYKETKCHNSWKKNGFCAEYVLDEKNPRETENRVIAFLSRFKTL